MLKERIIGNEGFITFYYHIVFPIWERTPRLFLLIGREITVNMKSIPLVLLAVREVPIIRPSTFCEGLEYNVSVLFV